MIEFLSQSMIGQWGRCPEQVRRRWIEGDIIPPGIAARIGSGVHKGAEINHAQKIHTGIDEPLDVIQDAARDEYVRRVNDGVFFPVEELPTAKKQLSEGVDMVTALAWLYRESLAPLVNPVAVERVITLEDDLPLPLRGIVDVYTHDKWLPDIKTAARKWPQSSADSSIQATLYRQLIKEEFGEYPEKISFEVFTKGKKPAHHSIETTREAADYEILKLRIHSVMKSINAGIFPPAEAGHWCCSRRWCGYYYSCQYIPKHKKILPKGL